MVSCVSLLYIIGMGINVVPFFRRRNPANLDAAVDDAEKKDQVMN